MDVINNIVNEASQAPKAVKGAFKVDVSKGGHNGTVSRQWSMRPADQRFLSLDDLEAAVVARSKDCKATVVETRSLRLVAQRDNAHDLTIGGIDDGQEYGMTHWTFDQICQRSKAPAGFLRKQPAFLSALNLQWAIQHQANEVVQAYRNPISGNAELRAITGPEYGRIYDHELVSAVRKIAGNGTGDTRWKVPGVLNWAEGTYNPFVDPTKDSTTLYASDRDVFMFLVDDTHPIEVGKLADGSPDLVFRGFYAWNSEVGSKTLGLATFLLRGVCMNRNLWGVEGFEEMTIRHSKHAPARFMEEAAPALLKYSEASTKGVVAGITAAKNLIVAKSDDERREWLADKGFSKTNITRIIETVEREEGHTAQSVWDMVQGITAVARNIDHQDDRIDMERKAGKLLAKAAKVAA